MPEFSISFEVFCFRCGAGLCNQSKGQNTRQGNQPYVTVEPCGDCLDKVYEEGYEKGYEEGKKEG